MITDALSPKSSPTAAPFTAKRARRSTASTLAVLLLAAAGLALSGCAMSSFTQRIPFIGGSSKAASAKATSSDASKADKKSKTEASTTAATQAPKAKKPGFFQRIPFIGGSSKEPSAKLASTEKAPAEAPNEKKPEPEKKSKPDAAVARSNAETPKGEKSSFMQRLPFFGGSKEGGSGSPDDLRSQAALQPSEPYWPYAIAQQEVDADSFAVAERSLQAALARDPSYAPALALLSKLYFQSGRHAEAVQVLEAARTRLDDTNAGFPPALLAGLALHYDALDRPDLAADLMSQVRKPESHGAGSARVYVVLRGESPDSAHGMAKSAVDREPKSAVAQNNFGITRLRAGDPEGARRAFLAAIELDPRLAGPYYNLAILEKFYLLDDPAAARWFKQYAERSQDDPDGLAEAFGKGEAKQLSERSE